MLHLSEIAELRSASLRSAPLRSAGKVPFIVVCQIYSYSNNV